MFKKKRLYIVFFISLLFSVSLSNYAFSADKQLYLVSGTPTPKSDAYFPVLLFKVNEDEDCGKLDLVREVTPKARGTEFVRAYHDKRIVVVETKFDRKYDDGNRVADYALINMDAPHEAAVFEIKYPARLGNIESHIFDIPNKGLYTALQVAHMDEAKKLKSMLLGLNLSTLKQEELPWEAYKHALLSGIPGGATSGGDWQDFYLGDGGELLIPLAVGRIKSEWRLPKDISFSKDDRIIMFVNNDNMLAIASINSRIKDAEGIGHTPFYIYNKKVKEWHHVQIQGGKTGVTAFGPWLVGYVADVARNTPSPGKSNRRKDTKSREDMTETGTPVDWRFDDFKIYSPGIVFLYNVRDKRKYTIETNEGDSEVLLVEEDFVYYRVNNKIYRAKIGKDKIEASEFLVKGKVVPDIHWAFMVP